MRILMVVPEGPDRNPFVPSLMEGLARCGHEVHSGLDRFWDSFDAYDLLFFQWPESIFDWKKNRMDLERLSGHLDRIRQSGVKTVITCHNLYPHNHDPQTMALYELVYSRMDAFHHMGRYSYDLFREKYPACRHFIAPHHVADSLWRAPVNSANAKSSLGIPSRNTVVAAFGAFRNSGETWLFTRMANSILRRDISFLAPRMPEARMDGGSLKKRLKSLYKKWAFQRIRLKRADFLTDEELGRWLSASDIVFIQRKEILNSGNVPLAFAAGKAVVGPDLGNVGEVLRDTGNFVFNPDDGGSVRRAVRRAIDEVRNGNRLGAENHRYAKENWTTSVVCKKIEEELLNICGKI